MTNDLTNDLILFRKWCNRVNEKLKENERIIRKIDTEDTIFSIPKELSDDDIPSYIKNIQNTIIQKYLSKVSFIIPNFIIIAIFGIMISINIILIDSVIF